METPMVLDVVTRTGPTSSKKPKIHARFIKREMQQLRTIRIKNQHQLSQQKKTTHRLE
jgi:hypothetical protein